MSLDTPEPRIKHFDHVGVVVTDMERSVAFYRDVLGMDEVERITTPSGGELVFLRMGEAGFVELIKRAGELTGRYVRAAPSAEHFCFEVNSLDAWLAKLARRQIALSSGPGVMQLPSGKVRLAFIQDPDGIPVELYEREHDV